MDLKCLTRTVEMRGEPLVEGGYTLLHSKACGQNVTKNQCLGFPLCFIIQCVSLSRFWMLFESLWHEMSLPWLIY